MVGWQSVKKNRVLLACLLLAAGVFAFDIFVPLGVAGAVPYVAVVLVSLGLPRRRQTFAIAALCSVLTVLGIAFSLPSGGADIFTDILMVVANRVLALFAIWVTAILGVQRKWSEQLEAGRSKVLERLATGESLEEVLLTLVRAIEQLAPDLLGSVLLLDREKNILRHGAAPSLPDFYNEAVDGISIGVGEGSCGTAASTGERVIVADVMTHPYWEKYREVAERACLRACWSEPIVSSAGEVLGTFAMYYRQPRAPRPVDLELIRSAAYLAGIAIEQKQAEQELHVHRDHLEDLVRKRAADLKEAYEQLKEESAERKQAEEAIARQAEELARSNAALEQRNHELQQFAFVASHDLQEPLRAISGFCQLLRRRYEGKLDVEADEFITHIVDGTTRMQNLIRGLLEYSRVGTHDRPLELTDCESVVDEAINNLKTPIEESGATVHCSGLQSVMADRAQMVQLFQNLISNAVKYRSKKPPKIDIKAEAKNGEWVFSVSDNGIGIEAEQAHRVFTIFQRLHTTDEYPGTGMGLAICKKIIARHQGRIWMESKPGKGSTFFFTMPTHGAKP